MTKALIVVDVQNDFLPGGALGVPEGDKVIEPIVAAAQRYDVVVTTGDNHPPDTAHFGKWPVHCVAGSEGAELHPDILALHGFHVVKGTSKQDDGYSAFEGTVVMAPDGPGAPLTDVLREQGVTEVDVAGLALDYCVKATALDAQSAGFKTTVLRNATAPVAQDTGEQAVAELEDAGVAVL